MSFNKMSFGEQNESKNAQQENVDYLLKDGDIVRIKRSHDRKYKIAYDIDGNYVTLRDYSNLDIGYARLFNVEYIDGEYFADAENVLYDFYMNSEECSNLSVEELTKVLELHGFTKQYETEVSIIDTFIAFANINVGAIVTVETYDKYGYSSYNRVILTMPCKNAYELIMDSDKYGVDTIASGSVVSFNLKLASVDFPITNILKLSSGCDWQGNNVYLGHSGDQDLNCENVKLKVAEMNKRILEFKDPVHELFNMGEV